MTDVRLTAKIIRLEKIYSSQNKHFYLIKLENNPNNFYLNFFNFQKYQPQLNQTYQFTIYQNKNGFWQIKVINTLAPECVCLTCELCIFKQFYQKQEQLKTGYLTLNGTQLNHFENKTEFKIWQSIPKSASQWGWTNLTNWHSRNN